MWNKWNIFVKIFWWHVFCEKNLENICFTKSFLKNLCNTGEQSVRQLEKFADFAKNVLVFAKSLRKQKKLAHFYKIFFGRSKHLNQYFLCRHWLFSRSFKSFSVSYTSINFLFASLKLLTETLLRFPFSVIGQYSIFYCQPLIDCREN